MAKRFKKKDKPGTSRRKDDWDPTETETRITGKAAQRYRLHNVVVRPDTILGTNQRDVAPHPRGGWVVMKPGATRVSAKLETQREAVARARRILINSGGGELVLHDKQGRIRTTDVARPPAKSPRKKK